MKNIEDELVKIECDLIDAINRLRRHPNFHPALEAIMPDLTDITARIQAVTARVPTALAAATAAGVTTGEDQAETAMTAQYAALDTATTSLEAAVPAPAAPAATDDQSSDTTATS
jgi:hypothetical protein